MSNFPEIQSAKVSLTAAQIKQLNTTPVEIIPGLAGHVVDLKSVFFLYTFGSVAFGPIDPNDTLTLINGTPPSGSVTTADASAAGFIDQTQNMGQWMLAIWYPPTTNSYPPSGVIGAASSLFQYNVNTGWPNGENWTTGDGSLTIFVRYAYVKVGA